MARPKRRSSSLPKPTRRDPAGAALLLAATPLLIGGAIALTVALSGATSPLGAWVKSLLGGVSAPRTRAIRDVLMGYARGKQPFAALRGAIIGSAKGSVVAVFGPPRTALLGRNFTKLSIWRAETWYYPLDRAERSAIAIRFERNIARDVEKIGVPAELEPR